MKKREIFAILIIIVLSLIAVLIIKNIKRPGQYVIVKVNGEEIAKYDLGQNGEFNLNNGTNILCIKDKKAYISYANCEDNLCIKQGSIDEVGETIICLPNKISIVIEE